MLLLFSIPNTPACAVVFALLLRLRFVGVWRAGGHISDAAASPRRGNEVLLVGRR